MGERDQRARQFTEKPEQKSIVLNTHNPNQLIPISTVGTLFNA